MAAVAAAAAYKVEDFLTAAGSAQTGPVSEEEEEE